MTDRENALPWPPACKSCPNAPPRIRVYASLTSKVGALVGVLTLCAFVFWAGAFYDQILATTRTVDQIARTTMKHDRQINAIDATVQQIAKILHIVVSPRAEEQYRGNPPSYTADKQGQ